jgi:hypothetical protein
MTGSEALKILKPLVFALPTPPAKVSITCYAHLPTAKDSILQTLQGFYPFFFFAYDTIFVLEKEKGPAVITCLQENANIRVEYLQTGDYEWLHLEGNQIYGDAQKPRELETIT